MTGSKSPSTHPPPQQAKCPSPLFTPSLPHPNQLHIPNHPSLLSTLSNLSQGQTYTVNINSGPALARVNADWVVERPYYGSTLAGFPTFTDVWFDDVWATTQGGPLSVVGAKQYQIPGLCASQECKLTRHSVTPMPFTPSPPALFTILDRVGLGRLELIRLFRIWRGINN
jgi:hypothetical protein